MSNTSISRRDLIQYSAMAMTSSFVLQPRQLWAQDKKEAHFYLQVNFPGGLDNFYTFDSRPLELTKEKLQANYLGKEPNLYEGSNGQRTFVTDLVSPLKKHLDRFSILNGVVMLSNFEGHIENANYVYTGNAFGGDSFIPALNNQTAGLDSIEVGFGYFGIQINNANNSIPINFSSATNLNQKLKALSGLRLDSPLMKHIQKRLVKNSNPETGMGIASWIMGHTLPKTPKFLAAAANIKLNLEEKDELLQNLSVAESFFKSGLSKSAVLNFPGAIDGVQTDCHDYENAKAYPKLIADAVGKMDKVFTFLRNTPYDDRNSLLDVTTVVVATEMGRTMRSTFSRFERSGTDHNSLKNTVLIGGKGIRGGFVLGESDYRDSTEQLSGAHLQLNPQKNSSMGRPFDFKTGRVRADLPQSYHSDDYLNYMCLINTIMNNFGVNPKQFFSLERNTPPANIISQLLA